MKQTNLSFVEAIDILGKASVSVVGAVGTGTRIAGSALADTEYGAALTADNYQDILLGEGTTSDYFQAKFSRKRPSSAKAAASGKGVAS